VGYNQCRAVDRGDGVGHREGLSGTGYAQQNLMFDACLQAGREFGDSLGLVAGWRII
jgi:hypothetical protein